MELVAYHLYHLEEQNEVIPWRDLTPEMVAKNEAFSKKCVFESGKKMIIRNNQKYLTFSWPSLLKKIHFNFLITHLK